MQSFARLLAIVAVALLASGAAVRADEPDPPAGNPQPDSLDSELLDSLRDQLLDDLDFAPAKKKPPDEAAQPDGADDDLDRQLRRHTGEDIELTPEEDPLTAIGRQMRTVEELISRLDPSEQTQTLQEQIVHDLDELIKQLRRQKKQSGSSSSQQMGSRRSKVDQPGQQAGRGDGGEREAQRPARDSTDRLGPDRLREIDMAEMQTLLRDLWGHLPERAREQMMQSSVEQFLPKYEMMIEKYFRRLAEESQDDPRN